MRKHERRPTTPRAFIETKGVGFEFSAYSLSKFLDGYTTKDIAAHIGNMSKLGMIRHVGYDQNSIVGMAGRPFNLYKVVKTLGTPTLGRRKKVIASPVRRIPVESYDGPYKISIDEKCNMSPVVVAPRAPESVDVVPVPEAETLPVADHLRLMNNMLDFLTSYEVLVNENKALRERLSRYEQP